MVRCLFLVLFSIIISIYGYCQDANLPGKISIHVSETSFEEVLQQLSEKYSVHFFYSASKIDVKTKVSLNFENELLSKVLDELCSQVGITCRIQKNQVIFITLDETRRSALNIISGFVADSLTGERLIGANILFPDLLASTVSNNYGYYSYSIPKGRYKIRCSYIGYRTIEKDITIDNDEKCLFRMSPQLFVLKEINLNYAFRLRKLNFKSGTDEVPVTFLKSYPALLGESDVVQFLKMMPGVQTSTDGVNGLFVRGCAPQHTSFLIDDVPMFNMYHISGWFSTINPDAIKDIKLYKSHQPIESGISLGSLVDIRLRDGNNQKYAVTGGIGTISSRLTIEGPIIKDKSSFIISARRTYLDQLIKLFNLEDDIGISRFYFYDINAKANYTFNSKDRLYLSTYIGNDIIGDKEGTMWGNSLLSLRWNHLYNDRLFSNCILTTSSYVHKFMVLDDEDNAYQLTTKVRNYSAKYHFTWFTRNNNKINYGINGNLMEFLPLQSDANGHMQFGESGKAMLQANSNAYLQAEIDIFRKLKCESGLRLTLLNKIKPKDAAAKLYPEFSFRLNYKPVENNSVRIGYSRNYQFYHGVSVFGIIIPFDKYIATGIHLKPQYADHFSSGWLYINTKRNLEFNLETYYSFIYNQYRFQVEEVFLDVIQDNYITGKSKAYGLEVSLRKFSPKFNVMVNYTLAKTIKNEDKYNSGNPYYPYYDRRHDLVLQTSVKLFSKLDFSATWVYMSGNPYNMPTGKYEIRGRTVPLYNSNTFNSYRMPDYHRLDLSLKYSFRKRKNFQHSITVVVFNVYGRNNSVLYSFRDVADNSPEKDPNSNYKTLNFSMLGYYFFDTLPAFSYEFKFD